MIKEEHKKTIEERVSTKNPWFKATALISIGAFCFSQAAWAGEIDTTHHAPSSANISFRSVFLKLKEETVSFLLPSAYAAEGIPVSSRQKSTGSMPYFYQYKSGRALQVAIEDENGKVTHYSSDSTSRPSLPSLHSDKYKPIVSPNLERTKVDSREKKADSISIPHTSPLIDATTEGEGGRPSPPKGHNEQVLAVIPESDSKLKRKDFSFGPQPEPPDDASSPEEPVELQKRQPEATSQVPAPVAPLSSQLEEQLLVSAEENNADVSDFTVVFYNDVVAFLYLENSLCDSTASYHVNGSRAPPVTHPGLNTSNKHSNVLLGEEDQGAAFHLYPRITISSDTTTLSTINSQISTNSFKSSEYRVESREIFYFSRYSLPSTLYFILYQSPSVDFNEGEREGSEMELDIDRDEVGVEVK